MNSRTCPRGALWAVAGTTATALAAGVLLVGLAPESVSTVALNRDRFETACDTTSTGGERLKGTELDDVASTSAPNPPSTQQEI